MKYLLLFSLVLTSAFANAQTIVDSVAQVNFSLDDGIGKKLAELATQNARMKAKDKEVENAELDVARTQGSWLDQFNTSFNLNEGNLRNTSTLPNGVNYFYPRYNLNLTVPLGIFFTKPKEVKMARATYEMKKAEKEDQMLILQKDVEAQYSVYKSAKVLLLMQELILQDEYILYSQAQQKFNDGTLELDKYTDAMKRYNGELTKKVGLVKEVAVAKSDLESLIGIDLERAYAYLNIKEQ